jgi:hypothetical protein
LGASTAPGSNFSGASIPGRSRRWESAKARRRPDMTSYSAR